MLRSRKFIFPNQPSTNGYILSLLPTEPPTPELAVGITSELPPTPDSLEENASFVKILQSVISEYAHEDPGVTSQAQAMTSIAGANLGSGGVFFSAQSKRKQSGYRGGGGAGDSCAGASAQGGAGSSGRGGWIHVSDSRNPPEYGRIAW